MFQALRHLLRDVVGGDAHAQCVAIGALEALVCNRALIQAELRGADAGSAHSTAANVILDLIQSASTPRAPPRLVQRCLLGLHRIAQARPGVPRPGLGALIALTLREGVAQCRAVCLELVAQGNVSVGGRDARQVVRWYRRETSPCVRVA